MLDASQAKGALPRADFYCGIYNSPDRLVFSISNLPAGRYALVMQKIAGKDPITLTLILQDVSGAWKLAGYYPRLDAIGGQDGQWYLAKAREYKSKGQLHNAWFYYLTAWDLMAPVNFMSTPQLDKIADEMQSARPSDLPGNGNPLNLAANGKTFKVTEMVAVPVEDNLDLRVRYETADASNTGVAFQDNMAVSQSDCGQVSRGPRCLQRGDCARRGRQRPRLRLGAADEGHEVRRQRQMGIRGKRQVARYSRLATTRGYPQNKCSRSGVEPPPTRNPLLSGRGRSAASQRGESEQHDLHSSRAPNIFTPYSRAWNFHFI